MEVFLFALLNGVVYGLLLFLLASGLTLIFSMMGVLNFAHASFYMLGAYFAYEISLYVGFWPAILVVPILVGFAGAMLERYGLRVVHKYGHVAELVFTFGSALLIEEIIQFIWGKDQKPFNPPEVLDFALFSAFGTDFPAYKGFMLLMSIAIFVGLILLLTKTRMGLIIQAAITHPHMVGMIGHNVPLVFMLTFGIGTALAGIAGVIAGPVMGTYPGMAFDLGSIIFVVVVFGGLGSLAGAFIASLLIGTIQTLAVSFNIEMADLLMAVGLEFGHDHFLSDLWSMSLPQIGPLIPYLMLVLMLIFRPLGLFGSREV